MVLQFIYVIDEPDTIGCGGPLAMESQFIIWVVSHCVQRAQLGEIMLVFVAETKSQAAYREPKQISNDLHHLIISYLLDAAIFFL